MHIAFTTSPGRGDTDLLLAGLADRLRDMAVRTAGVVQINTSCGDDKPCDMDVKVLPEGPVIRISQSLGAEAKGCRLDPSALEQSVAAAEARLADGADVLIVNKFGKHEAGGQGFRPVIAEALARGVPVIVGVNGANLPAFEDFTGGLAVRIAHDEAALLAWLRAVSPERDNRRAGET